MSKKQVLATTIPIDWVKVKSSTIQAVSYNKEAKAMHVMFLGGGVYELTPVRPDRHNAFMQAESKGKYYGEHFKNNPKITARRIGIGAHEPADTKLKRNTPVVVATPLYLALVKTKKQIEANPKLNSLYLLWSVCGKENTHDDRDEPKPKTRYHRCLRLIGEASGCNKIGPEYLDGAIALAAERKL